MFIDQFPAPKKKSPIMSIYSRVNREQGSGSLPYPVPPQIQNKKKNKVSLKGEREME